VTPDELEEFETDFYRWLLAINQRIFAEGGAIEETDEGNEGR